MISFYDALDKRYSRIIHSLDVPTAIAFIPLAGTLFCSVYVFPFVLVINIYASGFQRALLATLLTLLSSEALKHITKRKRPIFAQDMDKDGNDGKVKWTPRFGEELMKSSGTLYSFPSGDTAQAAVSASIWFHALKYTDDDGAYFATLCFKYAPFLLIPFVAFGRVYFRMHWLGDCIMGAMLGLGWCMVIFSVP